MIVTLRLDRARMRLISGFVDAYLRLNAREQRVSCGEVGTMAPNEPEAVMELTTSWNKEGLKQGRHQAAQEIVLRQLGRRFGPLPVALAERIQRLPTQAVEELADALLDFAALADAEAWVAVRS